MRLFTRGELRAIQEKVLPLPNSKDAKENIVIKLPAFATKSGILVAETHVKFQRIQKTDEHGTIKWAWAYCGPLPYVDDELVIDKAQKEVLEPTIETKRILI